MIRRRRNFKDFFIDQADDGALGLRDGGVLVIEDVLAYEVGQTLGYNKQCD